MAYDQDRIASMEQQIAALQRENEWLRAENEELRRALEEEAKGHDALRNGVLDAFRGSR